MLTSEAAIVAGLLELDHRFAPGTGQTASDNSHAVSQAPERGTHSYDSLTTYSARPLGNAFRLWFTGRVPVASRQQLHGVARLPSGGACRGRSWRVRSLSRPGVAGGPERSSEGFGADVSARSRSSSEWPTARRAGHAPAPYGDGGA